MTLQRNLDKYVKLVLSLDSYLDGAKKRNTAKTRNLPAYVKHGYSSGRIEQWVYQENLTQPEAFHDVNRRLKKLDK